MKRIATAVVVLVAMVLAFSPAAGQEDELPLLPQPGEQIRLTTDSTEFLVGAYGTAPLRWRHGALDSIGRTHLWMRSDHGQLSVPLGMVKTLQVKRKRHSALAVLAYGTLAGAALGTAGGLMMPHLTWEESIDYSIIPFTAFGFTLSLAMLPTLREGWRSVPIAAPPPLPAP